MLITQVIIWRKCVQQRHHFPARPVHRTLCSIWWAAGSHPGIPELGSGFITFFQQNFSRVEQRIAMPHLFPWTQHVLEYILSFMTSQGSASFCFCFCFSVKSQRANTWSPESHTGGSTFCSLDIITAFVFHFPRRDCSSASIIQICHCSTSSGIDDLYTNEHGCVLIKLYKTKPWARFIVQAVISWLLISMICTYTH